MLREVERNLSVARAERPRRPPRPPRRTRRGRRGPTGGSRRPARAGSRSRGHEAVSGRPRADRSTASSASAPARGRSAPCHSGRKRARPRSAPARPPGASGEGPSPQGVEHVARRTARARRPPAGTLLPRASRGGRALSAASRRGCGGEPEALHHVVGAEGPVRARVAGDEVAHAGSRPGIAKDRGRAGGKRHAERVAQPPASSTAASALLPADLDPERPPFLDERARQRGGGAAREHLVLRELADGEEEVVEIVGVPHGGNATFEGPARAAPRRRGRGASGARPRRAARGAPVIDGERLRAALRGGGVGLVDEAGDEGEQDAGGERRGRLRVSAVVTRISLRLHRAQQLHQAGEIEGVAQALPVGLEDDGKARVARDRRRAGRARASAGPRAASAARGSGEEAAARATRTRGSARRRARCRRGRG